MLTPVSVNNHPIERNKVTHSEPLSSERKGKGPPSAEKRLWSIMLTHASLARFYKMCGNKVNHSRFSKYYNQELLRSILVIPLAFSTVDKEGTL